MPRLPALAPNLHITEWGRFAQSSENPWPIRAATLKRWRHEGVGPEWIEIEGRVSYDVKVLLEYIQKNTRIASVRAAMEETREAV